MLEASAEMRIDTCEVLAIRFSSLLLLLLLLLLMMMMLFARSQALSLGPQVAARQQDHPMMPTYPRPSGVRQDACFFLSGQVC